MRLQEKRRTGTTYSHVLFNRCYSCKTNVLPHWMKCFITAEGYLEADDFSWANCHVM